MHKIHAKPFSLEDFSHDQMSGEALSLFRDYISKLEKIRLRYLEGGKKKEDWYDLIQLLPSSYHQLRTLSMDYETLVNIYFARRSHKLFEWHRFCEWIETLPYAEELILAEKRLHP